MILTLCFCFAAIIRQDMDGRPSRPPIQLGWHDELRNVNRWRPLDMDNKAKCEIIAAGNVRLSLGHVPEGWPYGFQWSGLKRNVTADVARFPVLMAFVGPVRGYAHLDVDVLDADGKAVKTIRSNTVNVTAVKRSSMPGMEGANSDRFQVPAGVLQCELAKELLPATYSMQIRMIVGGGNGGCSATYHWIGFVAQKDAEWLADHPNYVVSRGIPDFDARRR
ncbi:MAG: hypothetical protein P4L46_07795 [Fimbriimonas sp.]|nr:hypothetical protein [Fimbriimonas sp.]